MLPRPAFAPRKHALNLAFKRRLDSRLETINPVCKEEFAAGANAMDLSKTRVVIVGAGQAGARAAEALRAAGHCGSITLIGEEDHLPYERPQLSKSILIDTESNPAFIRTSKAWTDLDIAVSTASRAVAADIDRRSISCSSRQVRARGGCASWKTPPSPFVISAAWTTLSRCARLCTRARRSFS